MLLLGRLAAATGATANGSNEPNESGEQTDAEKGHADECLVALGDFGLSAARDEVRAEGGGGETSRQEFEQAGVD